jgi:uncharacterized protein YqgV (UPF0045/DUF77 family)
MQITVEISLYPLAQDYEHHIIDFIQRLKSHDDILVRSNAMSTYIQGNFDMVWEILRQELKETFKSGVPVSNVLKIIPRMLPLSDTWLEF